MSAMPPKAVRWAGWAKLSTPHAGYGETWQAGVGDHTAYVSRGFDSEKWYAYGHDRDWSRSCVPYGPCPSLEAAQAFAEQWAKENKR